jgi:cell surface protein SprA
VSLSVANAQVTEMKNTELVLGFGIVKSGLQLPIKIKGEPMAPLKNDVTFRFDVRFTDSKQVLRKLEGINTVTQGNILVSIKPNINYMVNQRLNLQIYYDQTINTPRVSTSFKRITTLFGIQLRFNLS